MNSNANKQVIQGLGCISPFEPTFNFSENKTKVNISREKSTNSPNYKKYTHQEFYNTVHNNTSNSTYEKIANKRIKILLSHYGKNDTYYD